MKEKHFGMVPIGILKLPLLSGSDAVLFGLTLAYVIMAYLASLYAGAGEFFTLWMYSEAVYLVSFLIAFVGAITRVVYIMVVLRPARLTHYIYRDFCDFLFIEMRLIRALPALFLFLVLMSAFTSYKSIIPLLNYYSWDMTFVRWDKSLHGGADPWRILQPILGRPYITSALNIIYNSWFAVMFAVFYWQIFTLHQQKLRMQYLFSFFLCWMILGSGMATVFSSVGPCFLEDIVGNSHYKALMDYLHLASEQAPVWAPATQSSLLANYRSGEFGLGGGISAMPSLHVSIAFLIAFHSWHKGMTPRVFSAAYAVLILLGSIHLGWHYAIDGYFAIALTWIIWIFCGIIINRHV